MIGLRVKPRDKFDPVLKRGLRNIAQLVVPNGCLFGFQN
jgi:hypothetical protein